MERREVGLSDGVQDHLIENEIIKASMYKI